MTSGCLLSLHLPPLQELAVGVLQPNYESQLYSHHGLLTPAVVTATPSQAERSRTQWEGLPATQGEMGLVETRK